MRPGSDREVGRLVRLPACATVALLIAAMLPAVAAAGADASGECEPAIAQAREASAPTPATGREEGMRVHIDPRTGRFVEPPAGAAPVREGSPALENALSTSENGLAEVASPTPGGGVMIELQGRFQSPLIGTVGPDGKLLIGHGHPTHR